VSRRDDGSSASALRRGRKTDVNDATPACAGVGSGWPIWRRTAWSGGASWRIGRPRRCATLACAGPGSVAYPRAAVREHSSHIQRLQKTLEDANIKLGVVIADIKGLSARRIIEALIAGETDPDALAALAHRRIKASPAELEAALRGRVSDHHRVMLRLLLQHIDAIDAAITQIDQEVDAQVEPFRTAVQHCAPAIRDSGGGSIVNISSTAGLTAHDDAAYTASKWGLRDLTKTAVLQFSPWNIRVNSMHPGQIADTGFFRSGSEAFAHAARVAIPLHRQGPHGNAPIWCCSSHRMSRASSVVRRSPLAVAISPPVRRACATACARISPPAATEHIREKDETSNSELQKAPHALFDLQVGSREASRRARETPLIDGPQLITNCDGIRSYRCRGYNDGPSWSWSARQRHAAPTFT
jgi:NAD(P)-dependent dehydrogenase (short-subunit alcohol dehydrogenase family)